MTTHIDAAWLAARSAPYFLTGTGETFILDVDVTTYHTAFVVAGNGITLDLNGHTITYGNRTPISIPNGDFETSDFTGWDFTNAPSFSRVAASPFAHGSYMLQGTISSEESFITPTFSPSVYPCEYVAWCMAKGQSYADTIKIELLRASDLVVLSSFIRTNPDRGQSPFLSHNVTTGDGLRIRITCTPSAASHTFWVDWIQFLYSRDYGVFASRSNYPTSSYGETYYVGGIPSQLWNVSGFSSRTLPSTFTLTDSTHTHIPLVPGSGLIVSGAGAPREGYAFNCNASTPLTTYLDGVQMKAIGIDSGCIVANECTRVEIINSKLECDIPAISNRMQTGYNVRKLEGSILIEDCTLLNNPNYGIGIKDAPGVVASSVQRNTITQRGIVTERYAIVLGQASNLEILHNTINVASGGSGRGILLDDDASGHTGDFKNIRIHGNDITVEEKQNIEYGITSLEVPGIRIRLKGTMGQFDNVEIDENTIHAETGATDDHVHGAYGIRILIRNPSGYVAPGGLRIHNNDIVALCSRAPGASAYNAAAIAIDRCEPDAWPIIYANDLESNDAAFRIGTNDGYNYTIEDVILTGNTFIKSASHTGLFTFASMALGSTASGTSRPIEGVFLLDNHYSGGAPTSWTWVDDTWTSGQTGKVYGGWNLNVLGSSALEEITISDPLAVLLCTGYANANGDHPNMPGPTAYYVHTKGTPGDTPTAISSLTVGYGVQEKVVSPTANMDVNFDPPSAALIGIFQ